ncbi:hypothetical protein EWB00_001719 [Schistosoma japonicum]|uniref:Uncharacterized protein n=1 Tax=Schistosoma japonicum TaxID=6182 RepID=A0A4Z2DEJ8_SCHJA|nr:hypothetical protein EWB00_001719 [Schistosoma japonicum]
MKYYYSLFIVLYYIVLSNGYMDDEIYQSEHGLYPTLPYITDDFVTDLMESRSKHPVYANKLKWYPNDSDNLDKNKVFYVHRRRFTRPYGR